MGIKAIVFLLVGLVLASVHLAEGQQPAKVARIGGLSPSFEPSAEIESFLRELRKLGYVAGKNIFIELRYAETKLDQLPALADELVRLKVDVLHTVATPTALAAKNATRTIPIVFSGVSDPVAAGLIDSLARPGGNITGFTHIGPVLAGKRLELLKETVPKLSHIAVLWDPKDSGSTEQWKQSQVPARELGLQLHSMGVSDADKYEDAFREATKVRSAALAVTTNSLAIANRKRIADLAARNRLPAIYPRADFVESGGLMSYGADQGEAVKRVAFMVDKILKGAKPC
jgi:putative ABC transport system substrate-binding protein